MIEKKILVSIAADPAGSSHQIVRQIFRRMALRARKACDSRMAAGERAAARDATCPGRRYRLMDALANPSVMAGSMLYRTKPCHHVENANFAQRLLG